MWLALRITHYAPYYYYFFIFIIIIIIIIIIIEVKTSLAAFGREKIYELASSWRYCPRII